MISLDDKVKLALIQEIKKYSNPPWRDDDPYFVREPWNKLGFCEPHHLEWVWSKDDYILKNATIGDLKKALKEYG